MKKKVDNTEQAAGVDMRKPISRELKQLDKRLQQIQKEEARIHKAMDRKLNAIAKAAELEAKKTRKEADKMTASYHKEYNAIINRQAILLGRLVH